MRGSAGRRSSPWPPSSRTGGRRPGLAAELFASTLDVYLTLGDIPPDPQDLSTADGRPATVDAARDRLARMVGADRDDFTEDDAVCPRRAADEALLARLAVAADRACLATVGRPRRVIVAGSGEFLARRLAGRVLEPGGTIVGLQRGLGPRRLDRRLRPCPGRARGRAVARDESVVNERVVVKVGGSLLTWPGPPRRALRLLASPRRTGSRS